MTDKPKRATLPKPPPEIDRTVIVKALTGAGFRVDAESDRVTIAVQRKGSVEWEFWNPRHAQLMADRIIGRLWEGPAT